MAHTINDPAGDPVAHDGTACSEAAEAALGTITDGDRAAVDAALALLSICIDHAQAAYNAAVVGGTEYDAAVDGVQALSNPTEYAAWTAAWTAYAAGVGSRNAQLLNNIISDGAVIGPVEETAYCIAAGGRYVQRYLESDAAFAARCSSLRSG